MTPRANAVDLLGRARSRKRGVQPRRGGNERRADARIASVLSCASMARLAADALLDQRRAVERPTYDVDRPPRDRSHAFARRRTEVLDTRPRPRRTGGAPFEVRDLVAHCSRKRPLVDHTHPSPAVLGQPRIYLLPLVGARPRACDGAEKAVHLRDGVVAEDARALPHRPGAKGIALVDHDRVALVPERARRQHVGHRQHDLLRVLVTPRHVGDAFHVHAGEVLSRAPTD
jgi:hypothetical protein